MSAGVTPESQMCRFALTLPSPSRSQNTRTSARISPLPRSDEMVASERLADVGRRDSGIADVPVRVDVAFALAQPKHAYLGADQPVAQRRRDAAHRHAVGR